MQERTPSIDRHQEARPVRGGPTDPIDVNTLLCGRQEVRLVHRGVEYRLRITRQGKLLLTK